MVLDMSGRQRNVFDRLSVKLTAIAVTGFVTAVAWAQAPAAPQYKPDEGPLVQSIQKETDGVKKLELLKQWEQKFPDSDFKGMRAIMIVQTEDPLVRKAMAPNAAAADAAAGLKAAQDLAENVDTYLSPANKQPTTTDEQWAQIKKGVAMDAYSEIAAASFNAKTPDGDTKAESAYKKLLEMSPDSGFAAYQLGVLILRERKVDRIPEGLFYVARGVGATGANALPAAMKGSAGTYLQKAYNGYHGSDDGLDDVKKAALASPNPPAGFSIESIVDIDKKKSGDEAAFNSAHPDIALWRTIRTALTAADGQGYFESSVKDAGLPPAEGAFKMFSARVVEQKSPKELLVAVDSPAGDALLDFTDALKGTIDVGTQIKFKGAVDTFNKDPFTLTFKDMDKEDIEGLPATAFTATPTVRKRPPAKKK
jgi:hypothetical protein